VGAILVGVTGARWLTNEVDKKLLKAAASQAAGSTPSPAASRQTAMASPASALHIAKSMRQLVAPVESPLWRLQWLCKRRFGGVWVYAWPPAHQTPEPT
jgi:hypothetical protein